MNRSYNFRSAPVLLKITPDPDDPIHVIRYCRNLVPLLPITRADEKRRRGRFHRPPATTSLGPVVDLSATGMRIANRGGPKVKEDQRIKLNVQSEHQNITLDVRVAWVKRSGLRETLIGLEFVDLSQENQKALAEIAKSSVGRDEPLLPESDSNAA
jgi:hypothetical protein